MDEVKKLVEIILAGVFSHTRSDSKYFNNEVIRVLALINRNVALLLPVQIHNQPNQDGVLEVTIAA